MKARDLISALSDVHPDTEVAVPSGDPGEYDVVRNVDLMRLGVARRIVGSVYFVDSSRPSWDGGSETVLVIR